MNFESKTRLVTFVLFAIFLAIWLRLFYWQVIEHERLAALRHTPTPPYAFTDQGIMMAATTLSSTSAINLSIDLLRSSTNPAVSVPIFPGDHAATPSAVSLP